MRLEYAFYTILRNPQRTVCSLLGVALGTMLITFLLLVSGNLSDLLSQPFRELFGPHMVLLPEGASIGRVASGYLGIAQIDKSVQAVRVPSPEQGLYLIEDSFDSAGYSMPVIARTFRLDTTEVRLLRGRNFSEADDGKNVVLLNREQGHRYPIGSELAIYLPRLSIDDTGQMMFNYGHGEPTAFEVIGHFRSPLLTPLVQQAPPLRGGLVLMPLATFQAVTGAPIDWAMGRLLPLSEQEPHLTVAATHQDMALGYLTGAVLRDAQDRLLRAVSGTYLILILFVSISLLALTLLLSLEIRRRELAILRTQGFQSRDIYATLLIEGGILGFTGGILGSLAAFACLSLALYYLSGQPVSMSYTTASHVLIISLTTSLLTMLVLAIPVRRFSRLTPAEVFRNE